MQKFLCPICGYPELDEPAYDPTYGVPSFDICACCGYEFGYGDPTEQAAKERFLKSWIEFGTPWFRPDLKPSNWSAKDQLIGIGIDIEKLRK